VRAERLLRIVILLQSRGKVTASELADELEVSVRTVQRDMEALSGAGIPVYAVRGGDGGWALLESYRTSLSGLTASDVLSIVVGRPPRLLKDLGLDDPGEGPVLKLMEQVSSSAKQQATHARQRIHVDLGGWDTAAQPSDGTHPSLPLLQQAVWDDRVVEIRYRASRSRFRVEPLGLVSKAGAWYLVATSKGLFRTYNVSRIHEIVVTDERFERPDDFDLPSHWERAQGEFVRGFETYMVKLRLRGDALARIQWTYAKTKELSEPDADGWVDAALDLREEENAVRTILALGAELIVVRPAKLRRRVLAESFAFVELNSGPVSPKR
jgi:predicted DNA-binding transcriptional regulator YafY